MDTPFKDAKKRYKLITMSDDSPMNLEDLETAYKLITMSTGFPV